MSQFFVEFGQSPSTRLVEMVEKVRYLLNVSRDDFYKVSIVPVLSLDTTMNIRHCSKFQSWSWTDNRDMAHKRIQTPIRVGLFDCYRMARAAAWSKMVRSVSQPRLDLR